MQYHGSQIQWRHFQYREHGLSLCKLCQTECQRKQASVRYRWRIMAPKWNVLISPADWPYNHKRITHLNFIFGGLFTEGFTSKCQDKFKVMRYAESALKTCFDSAINIVSKVAWTFSLVMDLTDLYIHTKRLFRPPSPFLSFCKFFQYSTADPATKSCTGETFLSIVCSVTEQIYQIQSWELFVREFLVFYLSVHLRKTADGAWQMFRWLFSRNFG